LSRLFCQDQDQGQDFYFQDQDNSVSRPTPRLYFLSSRCLETKTLVSRTTSLVSADLGCSLGWTLALSVMHSAN